MASAHTVRVHRLLNIMKGLFKSVEREWEEHAQRYNMTNAHMHVLWILNMEDGLKLSELALRGLWNLSTTQDIVNRMDQRGLIKKEKDILDGRITRVYLTEEGRRLRDLTAKDCDEGHTYKLLEAIDSLSEEEKDIFLTISMKIAEEVLDKEFMQYMDSSISMLERDITAHN